MAEITERIFQELQRQGASAYSMSKAIGVSKGVPSMWKIRDNDPHTKYIAPIADFLGVSCRWLLTGEEESDADLSKQEWDLVRLFRAMNEEGQEKLMEQASFFASRYIKSHQSEVVEGA